MMEVAFEAVVEGLDVVGRFQWCRGRSVDVLLGAMVPGSAHVDVAPEEASVEVVCLLAGVQRLQSDHTMEARASASARQSEFVAWRPHGCQSLNPDPGSSQIPWSCPSQTPGWVAVA